MNKHIITVSQHRDPLNFPIPRSIGQETIDLLIRVREGLLVEASKRVTDKEINEMIRRIHAAS
jgi:hypothetical protein